jgi:hypothetical protein
VLICDGQSSYHLPYFGSMKPASTILFALLAMVSCSKSPSDPAPSKPFIAGTWQLETTRVVLVGGGVPLDDTFYYAPGDVSLALTAAGTATYTSKNNAAISYPYTFDGTTLVFTTTAGRTANQVTELTDHRLRYVATVPAFGSSTQIVTSTYTR